MKLHCNINTLVLSLLFLCVASSKSLAIELPSPPEGYKWQKNIETQTAFLIPNGWFFHSSKKGETFGYFISKEKIVDGSQYDTGMMVNVIPKVKQNLNILPSRYMLAFAKSMVEKATKVEKQWEQNFGPFQGLGIEAVMGDAQNGWRQHALLIANDDTGTLYLVIFETPIVLWQQNWPVVEKTLKMLYMDTDF